MRRRKRSAAAQLRRLWLLLIVAIVAAAAAGYFAVRWPGFHLKRVAVRGNSTVSASAIVSKAAIDRHANLWLQNMNAAAKRVATIPDVGEVRIVRGFPASVTIIVSERQPFAELRNISATAIVDRDLRVLDSTLQEALPVIFVRTQLPHPGKFIADPRIARLCDDYARLRAAHVIVGSLQYDRFGELVAQTPRGIVLLLGDDDDLARKIRLIGPILSQIGNKKIASIDLRAPGTPVVVYR